MLAGSTVASSSSSAAPSSRLTRCARRVNSRACARCSASACSRGERSRRPPLVLRSRCSSARACARARSSATVRATAALTSSRYTLRSRITVARPSSSSTPAALRLVDLGLGEPDRRRPVGVAVELLVQRLRLRCRGRGLLAELQLGDLRLVQDAAGELGEQPARPGPLREHLAHQPARVVRELRAEPVAVRGGLGDDLGDHAGELRADGLDLQQGVDPGDRDLAAADQRLRRVGQLEDPRPRGHAPLVPAEHGRGAVERVAVGEHLLDRARLLQRRQRLAQHVLGALVAA